MKRWRFIVRNDGHTFAFDCTGETFLEAQYQAMLAYPDADTITLA